MIAKDRFLLAGVMGWPVHQSRSPMLHNYWFKQHNLAGTFVPMAVKPENIEAALRGLPALGFSGVNITIPHKQTSMPLKTQLCTSSGEVIEQIVFSNIDLPERIPNSMFKPLVDASSYRWLRADRQVAINAAPPALWEAMRLPPGFRMATRSAQALPGSSEPVAHLVFTDGIDGRDPRWKSQRQAQRFLYRPPQRADREKPGRRVLSRNENDEVPGAGAVDRRARGKV